MKQKINKATHSLVALVVTCCFAGDANASDINLELLPGSASPGFVASPETFTFGYTWKKCERADAGGGTLPFEPLDGSDKPSDPSVEVPNDSLERKLIPECAPDTLYTWQKTSVIQAFVDAARANLNAPLAISRQLFFSRTPLETFGYGTYDNSQLRVKLKRNVNFKYVMLSKRDCNVPAAEKETTVYVDRINTNPGWVEYYICSGGPVESWSTNTRESYREMLAERKWVETHTPRDYDTMFRRLRKKECPKYECALWGDGVDDDDTDWTSAHLDHIFSTLKTLTSLSKGEIFFGPGIPHIEINHFKTKTPGYFNPVSE